MSALTVSYGPTVVDDGQNILIERKKGSSSSADGGNRMRNKLNFSWTMLQQLFRGGGGGIFERTPQQRSGTSRASLNHEQLKCLLPGSTSKSDLPVIHSSDDLFFPDDAKEGLFNVRALTMLVLWYFFSFCTLFLNKFILSALQGEPTLLGAVQMTATTCLGFVQMYIPCGLYRKTDRSGKPRGFWRNMALVGCMRFSTVVLGLFALKYISVSFTETVKSTAPLFTVIIAWLILDERCGLYVISSLVPIMGGLALCSAYELSFHLLGFLAAVATNLMDCLQNVFSKLLISGAEHRYTPAELQFYTSVASIFVQIPATFFVMDLSHALQDLKSSRMTMALTVNGLCFHLQSITAYSLMGYISPITHSVANTTKRAILIWLSVLVFGNEVTFWSAIGTALVLVGVLFYNKARDYEMHRWALTVKIAKSEQI